MKTRILKIFFLLLLHICSTCIKYWVHKNTQRTKKYKKSRALLILFNTKFKRKFRLHAKDIE